MHQSFFNTLVHLAPNGDDLFPFIYSLPIHIASDLSMVIKRPEKDPKIEISSKKFFADSMSLRIPIISSAYCNIFSSVIYHTAAHVSVESLSPFNERWTEVMFIQYLF